MYKYKCQWKNLAWHYRKSNGERSWRNNRNVSNHYLFIIINYLFCLLLWLNKKRTAPRKRAISLFFIISLLFDCRKRKCEKDWTRLDKIELNKHSIDIFWNLINYHSAADVVTTKVFKCFLSSFYWRWKNLPEDTSHG